MEEELDFGIGINKLNLYYEAHVLGFDGECFNYNIYFEDKLDDNKFKEVEKAIEKFKDNYNYDDNTYIGYIDVAKEDNRINIFLDVGNVQPEYQDIAIQGILKAINIVPGIKYVLVNEE